MSNEYGLRCPKCGQEESFEITASHTICVNGENLDHSDDDLLNWNDDDKIICGACKHEGTVTEFEEQ